MDKKRTVELLYNFTKTVVSQARRNMTLQSIGMGKQGKLYQSFETPTPKAGPNSIEVDILSDEYNAYGRFVNYGVTGVGFIPTESKKGWKHYKSIKGWRFRDKMPPPSALDRDWETP